MSDSDKEGQVAQDAPSTEEARYAAGALELLKRIDLKAAEVDAYVAIRDWLRRLIGGEPTQSTQGSLEHRLLSRITAAAQNSPELRATINRICAMEGVAPIAYKPPAEKISAAS